MDDIIREKLKAFDGFFVGFLSDEEIEVFKEGVKRGIAYRSYEGGGGLMGLAKVRLRNR